MIKIRGKTVLKIMVRELTRNEKILRYENELGLRVSGYFESVT